MNLTKMGVVFLASATGFLSIQAQTADDIVNKYVEALGGKAKLEQIKSAYIMGNTQVMGNNAQSTTRILEGKGFRLEYEANGQKVVQVFTDKGGWQINPMMGSTTAQPIPDEMYKGSRGQIFITGPLFNYAAKGNKVELVGKEGNDYKLKITNVDSVETTVYIDGSTYYLTKLTRQANFMGQPTEMTINFSNFKKTDFGVVFPYQTEINIGGQFTITSTLDKVEINKPVDPAIFEMPKS
jgi:outer membrane lipoprotein-sorting protein